MWTDLKARDHLVRGESIIIKGIFKNWMRKHEIDQTEDRNSYRVLVNAAMNICFAQNGGIFLTA
jgi:hypothetical protein